MSIWVKTKLCLTDLTWKEKNPYSYRFDAESLTKLKKAIKRFEKEMKKEKLIKNYLNVIVRNIKEIGKYEIKFHYTPERKLYAELNFWFFQNRNSEWLKLEKALRIFAGVFPEIPFSVDFYTLKANFYSKLTNCKYFELNGEQNV